MKINKESFNRAEYDKDLFREELIEAAKERDYPLDEEAINLYISKLWDIVERRAEENEVENGDELEYKDYKEYIDAEIDYMDNNSDILEMCMEEAFDNAFIEDFSKALMETELD